MGGLKVLHQNTADGFRPNLLQRTLMKEEMPHSLLPDIARYLLKSQLTLSDRPSLSEHMGGEALNLIKE